MIRASIIPQLWLKQLNHLFSGAITQQKSRAAKTISARESQPSRRNCLRRLPVVHPGEVICQNNSGSLTCSMGGSHLLSTDRATEAPRGIIETGDSSQ